MGCYNLLLLLAIFGNYEGLVLQKNIEKLNNRPIIAVIAQVYPWYSNQSYIAASYIKYLESAGARVVPIPHYFSKSKIAELFQYVNGVLFPGGGIEWFVSAYYKNANQFWKLAISANDKGDFFPVWGTCLGFEAMAVIRANKRVTSRRVADDVANSLIFTKGARSSRLLKNMHDDLYKALASEEITYNHHNYGVAPETIAENPDLHNFFKILSLNNDQYGKSYVSSFEAHDYPFYGVQWHPEKNNFELRTHFKNIPHTANAIRASQYMANFFVNEARKNFYKFPTKKMEDEHLIYRYTPIHSALKIKGGSMSHFEQVYIFKKE